MWCVCECDRRRRQWEMNDIRRRWWWWRWFWWCPKFGYIVRNRLLLYFHNDFLKFICMLTHIHLKMFVIPFIIIGLLHLSTFYFEVNDYNIHDTMSTFPLVCVSTKRRHSSHKPKTVGNKNNTHKNNTQNKSVYLDQPKIKTACRRTTSAY